jgi:hypothetical protein
MRTRAGGNTELMARLRYTDEEGAVKEIIAAINEAGGSVQKAADKLRVAKRTLFLWAADYDAISEALRKARRKKMKEVTP